MKRLYTIGYEGAALEDFLATLNVADIDMVLDVRELPMSRRKGFSKKALTNALAQCDIDYRHEKRLGSPKTIRHKLRADGDYQAFFRAFNQHLRKQNELLLELAEVLSGNVALMCYEKDHRYCHRASVVDALSKMLDLIPVHMEVNHHELRKARQTIYPDPGQGVSPA